MKPAPHIRLLKPPEAEPPAPAPLDTAALYRRYAAYVATCAHRLLGRDDEVDDIVQEVFLVALGGLGALRDPEAIRGWLATVTVRRTARRLRLRRLRRLVGLDEAPRYEDVAEPGSPAEDRLLVSRLYALLDRLPIAERLAWSLRHLEGETLEVVASRCGCSLATAKRRIAAAHQTLERMLRHD